MHVFANLKTLWQVLSNLNTLWLPNLKKGTSWWKPHMGADQHILDCEVSSRTCQVPKDLWRTLHIHVNLKLAIQ